MTIISAKHVIYKARFGISERYFKDMILSLQKINIAGLVSVGLLQWEFALNFKPFNRRKAA